MSRKPSGRCHICGCIRKLTREHVIPESAGNGGNTSVHTLNSVASRRSRGELFQNGLTRSTLCEQCNHDCGRHYVRQFAQWTLQAATYHTRLSGNTRVLLPFTIVPLAVAKQIAVITLAMANVESLDLPHFLYLRRFVVSPSLQGDIGSFRFWAYLHFGPARFDGAFYAIDAAGGPNPMVHCHVGREPLGYVVTANDGASLNWARRMRLCDLSGFAMRHRNVISVEYLWLPCLRGELPFRPQLNGHNST